MLNLVTAVKSNRNVKNTFNFNRNSNHDSARKHVTGSARYVDDIAMPEGTLHAYLGLANCTHGLITSLDLDAIREIPGVKDVFTANAIPGVNDISPTGSMDEPILAHKKVLFWGQPVYVVLAETRELARQAARKGKIVYEKIPPIVDIKSALEKQQKLVTPAMQLQKGDVLNALKNSPHRLSGQLEIGGQDHFYMEGQVAVAIPGEDDEIEIVASTQHPSEVQHMVASALQIQSNLVKVRVRRMGGAFGGKETQSNQFAVIAALAARRNGVPVKLRLDRDDDMICTGKRHDFLAKYDVGFDGSGRILSLDAELSARCGFSADLSGPVTDRALFHVDNCYFLPAARLTSKPLYTNTVSNTAFRGFGGPQGMMVAERVIQEIAFALQLDPLEVRKINLYDNKEKSVTPYHQVVNDSIVERLIKELEHKSDYRERRKKIIHSNRNDEFVKRGIALTPVKFGISFTATWYNQAGALVHIYKDGSIYLNHGGTEMGQGLNTKVATIVATEFGLSNSCVRISSTDTSKVPNTSATAASAGADLNGMAALNAAQIIKGKLLNFAQSYFKVGRRNISFGDGQVFLGEKKISFKDFIVAAYKNRIQLSATGFYKTPTIHWDRDKGMGHPFYYFAYGAAVSEVSVDTFTGEYKVERVDILHDVGNSLNPEIDLGQVEGGFIQGLGWLTTEQLFWNDEGELKTHAPSTYKIPLISDRPRTFNISLASWSKNKSRTIKRSKAVGEPPFMLAISVHEALGMAISSCAEKKYRPNLNSPATPEEVLQCIANIKG